MKKIIFFMILSATCYNLISNDNFKIMHNNNELIKKLIAQYNNESIDDLIAILEKENQQLLIDIVRLQMDLAKMRVNGGGKGTIKPKLQQVAQKIIETIQDKKHTIAHNKAAIQALILSDPNKQLNTPIYAKPIQYYKIEEKTIKKQDKKSK